jgi:phosphohistidine swiveling domain-containing protein
MTATNTTSHEATPAFEPPGPGGWKSLADHFPGALTAEYQRLYAETCPPGMADYMSRYGVLARTLDVAFVHGHLYITPVPLAGPREMRWTPPTAAVWLMARLHPEFRRRTRAARRALDERPWREAATSWFSTERAEWSDRNRRLEDETPGSMTVDGLIAHLRDCRRLVVAGYRRHFELHGDDLLPIGLLIARCDEWGIEPSVAARALHGAVAPVPVPPPAASQLMTGYDLDSLSWQELGAQAAAPRPEPTDGFDLRPLVAEADHPELEQLVADARAAVPLRDDNGAITGAWPMGLLRRAMSEAGRRLGLDDPTVAVEATVDELAARLGGASGPTRDELRLRRSDRARRSAFDAPTSIGPEFAIPPLAALPRPLALIGAAQLATADNMLAGTTSVGVGDRRHTGRAVVVDDPARAMDMIEPGDVVITRATSPSWNSILVLAGAIVTTTGGLVSHAAVIARELGIPAVVGDTTATERIVTGTTVTVDPVRATVTTE